MTSVSLKESSSEKHSATYIIDVLRTGKVRDCGLEVMILLGGCHHFEGTSICRVQMHPSKMEAICFFP
jgi:hypothetical protein